MSTPSFTELGSPSFWRGVSAADTLPVTVVLPSGRAEESTSPHLALSTDGLLLPEIALALGRLATGARLVGVSVESALDIDIAERLHTQEPLDSNLLVIGSADINVVAKLLLDRTGAYDAWRVGFTKPYDLPAIKDSRGRLHMFTTSPRLGILALYTNPWSVSDRLAILTAGLFAVGTVAANRLLLQYLTGERADPNAVDPSIPVRLVDGIVARYPSIRLKAMDECVPQMDLLNISAIEVVE